jgi:poly-gamma-glutamate synthesis protein (capsule biosynthesis protein)
MTAPYVAQVLPLSESYQARMIGRSWRDEPECPPFSALRLVRVTHLGFDGRPHTGELVVASEVAHELAAIFEHLYAAHFPIERMELIDGFFADDDASMAANNSSAFNFRFVAGTRVLSHHALGLAIDVNPVQNPWLRGELVDPPAGRAYLDRDHLRPGMIVRPGPVVTAFEAYGWYWGGDFEDTRDYHHFSKLAR